MLNRINTLLYNAQYQSHDNLSIKLNLYEANIWACLDRAIQKFNEEEKSEDSLETEIDLDDELLDSVASDNKEQAKKNFLDVQFYGNLKPKTGEIGWTQTYLERKSWLQESIRQSFSIA